MKKILSFENKQSPFRDGYGNMLPSEFEYRSENPSTINASHFFVGELLTEGSNDYIYYHFKFINKYTTNNESWRTMEYDPNPDWSIDEKVGTLAYFSYNYDSVWLDKIPLFPSWNNSSKWSWFRPDILAYTFGSKYKWSRNFLWFFVIHPKIKHSLKKFYADPGGKSSGIQQAFILAMGWRRLDFVNDHQKEIKQAMDSYYWRDEDHPIRLLWKKLRL